KTTLNNEQRKEVIAYKEKNPSISHVDLTIHCPDLVNILLEWILQNQDKIVLSNAILVKKVKSFAQKLNIPEGDLKFSYGWLYKFKKWHGLEQITKHGEEASVDKNVIATLFPIYEMEKENKIDVLTAIKYTVRAWREVTPNMELVTDNNEEFVIDDNDEFIEKLYTDIEVLHFQNVMDLDNYINYPGENDMNKVFDNQEI
ncbi:28677_t:CDS:2, partial [Gigaspora margarita]